MCNCGVPNKANTYYFVIIGRGDSQTGTETSYVDIYVCTEHDPGTEHDYDVRTLLEFDGSEDWDILEVTRTEIR